MTQSIGGLAGNGDAPDQGIILDQHEKAEPITSRFIAALAQHRFHRRQADIVVA